MSPVAWLVMGAEARRAFTDEAEATAFAGSWGKIIPLYDDVGALARENDRLRALLGNSNIDCMYCGLPKERWQECADGFPGCSRADDAMLCPHVGAELETQEEVERLRALLQKTIIALDPIANAVFNDNGDMTITLPRVTYEQCITAYFARKQAKIELENPA